MLAVACAAPKPATTDTPSSSASATPAANDTASLKSRIAQLEADARALAKTTGCSSADQCRTAPVGERACGGPRDYIVYCVATTDSVALFRKLGELREAEMQYNSSSNMMSTCEFRVAPMPALQGRSCSAPKSTGH